MGYELLTGKTAFPPGLPRGTIRRMLNDKAPLPWEDHANSSEFTDELADNELKGIVLSCLARKPAVRPSTMGLASTLHKLLAASPLLLPRRQPPPQQSAARLRAGRPWMAAHLQMQAAQSTSHQTIPAASCVHP